MRLLPVVVAPALQTRGSLGKRGSWFRSPAVVVRTLRAWRVSAFPPGIHAARRASAAVRFTAFAIQSGWTYVACAGLIEMPFSRYVVSRRLFREHLTTRARSPAWRSSYRYDCDRDWRLTAARLTPRWAPGGVYAEVVLAHVSSDTGKPRQAVWRITIFAGDIVLFRQGERISGQSFRGQQRRVAIARSLAMRPNAMSVR